MKKIMIVMLAAALYLSGCGMTAKSPAVQSAVTTVQAPDESAVIAETTVTGANDRPFIDMSWLFGNGDDGDYPDKLYQNDEKNAELLVFRTGDVYLTYSLDRKMAGWTRTSSDVPVEMEMTDGCFELITADITRYYGGVAGYMGDPYIKKPKSISTMTQAEAIAYCGMEQYKPGEIVYSEPRYYGDYIIIRYRDDVRVYREGRLLGDYGTEIQAEAAVGLREIPDTSVKMERLGDHSAYVFRCGDTYLAYCAHIGMNPCWTRYVNSDFGNEPEAFSLNDGEGVYIMHADVIKLNGGNARYVNTPMITSAEEPEWVGYDIISRGMEPFWAENRAQSAPEATSPEWAEFSDGYNAMFDRTTAGTWLIYCLDDKYYVYLDDHTQKQRVAVCDTVYETAKLIAEYK